VKGGDIPDYVRPRIVGMLYAARIILFSREAAEIGVSSAEAKGGVARVHGWPGRQRGTRLAGTTAVKTGPHPGGRDVGPRSSGVRRIRPCL